MAEITLDPITLQGNATTMSVVSRILVGRTGALSTKATVATTVFNVIKYIKSATASKAGAAADTTKYKTINSNLIGVSKLETYLYDREIRESMLGNLPQYYHDFKDFGYLINSETNELTRLYEKLEGLFDQFYVETASYSLNDWQTLTNISQSEQDPLSSQRERIKRRISGIGIVKPSDLKAVVDDFYESELTEFPKEGKVQIKITGRRGKPDDIDDIEISVNELIPAHLEPKFSFSFLPWSEVQAAQLKWEEAEEYTYKGLEEAYLI